MRIQSVNSANSYFGYHTPKSCYLSIHDSAPIERITITKGNVPMYRLKSICRRSSAIVGLLSAFIIVGCSSAPETDAEKQARWTAGNLTTWETEHGIGPIAESANLGAVDPAKAAAGKEIFIKKCATCHYLDHRKTGPALRDISKRRSNEYIMNQILNPEQMGKLHPDGRKMVAQYAQFMTIQGISKDDALQLLDFLRSERDNPALPIDQQVGFGVPPPAPGTATPGN